MRLLLASLLLIASAAREVLGLEMLKVVTIAESTWRQSAQNHCDRIRKLLLPGLKVPPENGLAALDPKNPIYNFLIEYYGIKGAKGPRRLARWSPDMSVLMESAMSNGGVLLEGATEADFTDTLHVRGSILEKGGVRYCPGEFFGRGDPARVEEARKAATPYLWYRSVLQQTLQAEPITHCHGLHEWAMQYHPEGAPPPPSAKYQQHLPLRVDRETINSTCERKGISCTHVDALRFFAPAAGPLNHHGDNLLRTDQLRLEQPACVHAQMDLLKIALRLQPFCKAELLQDVLAIALEARRLDVAASPYDASDYGLDPVPVETSSGRAEYRRQQIRLMRYAEPVRIRLIEAYDILLATGFEESSLEAAKNKPNEERFAKAEPGGLPWRKNLVQSN